MFQHYMYPGIQMLKMNHKYIRHPHFQTTNIKNTASVIALFGGIISRYSKD
jgi:hypothetical protein